jgi:hypothetical protein
MGFLDNSSITVDAILTKVGRERLSQGAFQVSRFALSDEEIDYTLYDVTHPNGTDAYGTVIENMNLLEANPNRIGFNSHLVNDSISGAKIKLATLNYSNVDSGDLITLSPSTEGANAENYSFVVENVGIAAFQHAGSGGGYSATVPSSKTARLIAQAFGAPSPTATTNVNVTGLQSGLTAVVSLTVNYTPTDGKDANNPNKDAVLKTSANTTGNQQSNTGGRPPANKGDINL